MTRPTRVSSAALAALFVCAAGSARADAPTFAPPELRTPDVVPRGGGLPDESPGDEARPPFLGESRDLPSTPFAGRECVTEHGTERDADGDGIPRHHDVVIDCAGDATVSEDGTRAHVTVRGTVSVDDADDHDARSGFTLRVQDLVVRAQPAGGAHAGQTLERRMDRTLVLRRAARGGAYTLDDQRTSAWTVSSPRDETPPRRQTLREVRAVRYQPDSARAPFAAGSVTERDELTLTRDGATPRTLRRETAPTAHWSAACQRAHPELDGFDRGAFALRDGDQPALRVEFSACGLARVLDESGDGATPRASR